MSKTWKQVLSTDEAQMDGFGKDQPGAAQGFFALHKAALSDGALDTKHKELMALAIGIARQCVDCIGFHTRGAMRAGASREEIEETVSVCLMMGGGPAFMYGIKALEVFDELSA